MMSSSSSSISSKESSECPSCGSVEAESDNVCPSCGTLVDSYSSLVADKSGYLTFAPGNTSTTSTASTNHYGQSKNEIIRFAEANVSGDSKKQVLQSVKKIIAKGGVLFRKEAVAAAAAYHVFRSSSNDLSSVKDFSLRFGANVRDIQRVLKALPPLEPPKEDNYVCYIRDILLYGEFWDASGSGIDNESMIQRVVRLARILGRPFLSQEFVLAASIVLYRAEAWNTNRVLFKRRLRGSVEEILGEVGLLHSSLNPSKVSLETRNILKKCKELVRRLPYVMTEENKTRSLKSGEVYYYIDDLLKHSDLILYSSSSAAPQRKPSSTSSSSNNSSILSSSSLLHQSFKRPCDENEGENIGKSAPIFKKPRKALMTRI